MTVSPHKRPGSVTMKVIPNRVAPPSLSSLYPSMANQYDANEDTAAANNWGLMDIFYESDVNGPERRRTQGRVLTLLIGPVVTLLTIYFWGNAVYILHGIAKVSTKATATGVVGSITQVLPPTSVIIAMFALAALCSGLTVLACWLNWLLRADRRYGYSEAATASWFWGTSFVVLSLVAWLIGATSYTPPHGELAEKVNNYLVNEWHLSSDNNYAKSTTEKKDFLTRNIDGQWVYFTVTATDSTYTVVRHEAPQPKLAQ